MSIPDATRNHRHAPKFRQFDPAEALEMSLPEAIILQQIRFWLEGDAKYPPKRWVYNSYPQWQAQFPFWSVKTIQRALDSLVERGVVIVEMRQPISGASPCNHYRLADELVEGVWSKSPEGLDILTRPSGQIVHGNNEAHNTPDNTLNNTTPKVVRQKKAKEPQEPDLIKLAEKIHGYITRKMKEHNLLPGALKFDTEVTANILRQLRDIDKIPEAMIGTVLAWTWSYEFDNGTLYGSVLTSPAQWRNRKPGASTNKFQNAYASWLRETGGVQNG